MPEFKGRGKYWLSDSPDRIMTASVTFDALAGSVVSLEILDDTLHRPHILQNGWDYGIRLYSVFDPDSRPGNSGVRVTSISSCPAPDILG